MVVVEVLSGITCGALAGGWIAWLSWWRKDSRDRILRRRGWPLPRDRVFPHYHEPAAVLGGSWVWWWSSQTAVPWFAAALGLFGMPLAYAVGWFLPHLIYELWDRCNGPAPAQR